MKRWTKVCLIAAAVLFSVGVGCILTSVGLGLTSETAKDTARRYLKGFHTYIDWDDIDWFTDMDENDWDDDVAEKEIEGGKTMEYAVSDIDSLEMDLKKAYVKILPAAEEQKDKMIIKIDQKSEGRLTAKQQGRTLELECETSGKKNGPAYMEIYLPEHIQWNKIDLSLGAGKLESTVALAADLTALEVGGGTVSIPSIKTKYLEAEIGAGQLNMDFVDADETKIEVGAGAVRAGMAGSKDQYQSAIEVAAGQVNFGDETYSGLANSHKNSSKDAIRKIQIDVAAGEVTVTFQEEI